MIRRPPRSTLFPSTTLFRSTRGRSPGHQGFEPRLRVLRGRLRRDPRRARISDLHRQRHDARRVTRGRGCGNDLWSGQRGPGVGGAHLRGIPTRRPRGGRQSQDRLYTLVTVLRNGVFPLAIKCALHLQGVCEPWSAPPTRRLDEPLEARLREKLAAWELLTPQGPREGRVSHPPREVGGGC